MKNELFSKFSARFKYSSRIRNFFQAFERKACSFMVLSALFHNESIQYCSLVDKSVIDRLLHHGDGMYYSDELSNS